MRIFVFACLFICVFTVGCQKNRHTNHLFYSNFENSENVSEKWILNDSYRVDSCLLQLSENSFSGEKSFQIGRIWCDSWARAGIETAQAIEIQPGKKYILNFWYKTENFFEYSLPLVLRLRVERENHDPLDYSKSLSWSEFKWKEAFFQLENLPPDAVNVQIQLFTRYRSKGSIFIDELGFFESDKKTLQRYEQWRRQEIPIPRAARNKYQGKKNGFFQLAKSGNRWWLVKPDGSLHWSVGTMAAMPGNSGNGNTEVYNWYKNNYGNNAEGFANMLYDSLSHWGFNSFAGWTSDYFASISKNKFDQGDEYFPMYRVLGLARMGDKDYYAKNRDGEMKDGDHSMVDPFNPTWQKEAREKAEKLIPEYKDEPWFVGWYIDNEIDINDLFKFVWAEYSSQEFINRLQEKYQTIENLNKAWSSTFGKYNFTSFESVQEEKPEPKDWEDPLYSDFVDFERAMLKKYIDFTYHLVKELDPNHLLISNRINLGPMCDLHRSVDLWGKYDLICMNIYPQNLKIGFSEGELEIMRKLHAGTGKPVIIGEWSVPAISDELYSFNVDPLNRPLDWSWPQVVRNQSERGEVYKACMLQLASLDFMVGAGWFKPIDVNSPVRRANRGLINGNFEPYGTMIDSIIDTHKILHGKLNQ